MCIGALTAMALAAPLLAPYAPNTPIDIIGSKSLPPSTVHWFGTDNISRDVLSRVLYGARVSLAVAAAAVAVSLGVGTTIGAVAAMAGGMWDAVLMRIIDVFLSIPRVLLLLAVSAIAAPLPLLALVALIGFTGWFDVARLVRGEVQSLLGRDYILAARASGVADVRLLRRHIIPHLLPVLAVNATMGVASTIALESGLSYLGVGVQNPTASWGSIIQLGKGLIDTQWWLTLFPGLAAIIAVLACNALGDALRDHYAP